MYNVKFPALGIKVILNPIAFNIGTVSIYWYGIIISISFLIAYLYVLKNAKRFNLDSNKLTDCIVVGLITGIIGARLYYVLFYPGTLYKENPITIFFIHQGGIGIYGGIIGGLIGGIITAKVKRCNIPSCLDITSLGLLIGQSIGRWGNFVNQEAFGVATSLPWGMMSEKTLMQTPYPVHPCFLYESLWCLLGFILLDLYSKKFQKYSGQLFLMYIVWYGLERFIVESLRTDSLIIPILGLRVSQVVAAISVITGVILLFIFKKRKQEIINRGVNNGKNNRWKTNI